MTKMAIIYVDENTARVTKAFMKRANIFGTDEFKLWREYKAEFPNAVMTTKKIKKNPDKKTTRNMTYDNMEEFLSTLPNSKELLDELEIIKKRSLVQKSPYHYVLDWFSETVEGYDDFKKFAAQKEAENKQAETQIATNEAEKKQSEIATTSK